MSEAVDREWMVSASCRGLDPELWFPEQGYERGQRVRASYDGPSARIAKRICVNCPVIMECQQYARETQSLYGIWGAFTPSDRARLEGRPRRLG